MFKRLLCILCALALTAPLVAATARKKAKPAEPESALSPALAKPVSAGIESLQGVQEAMKKGAGKRPAVLIRKVDAAKAELKQALERVRDARVDDDEAAAKDGAVVAVAAGLRAADMVVQGLQEDDDDQVDAGMKLGQMALGDLESLEANGDSGVTGGGGGGGEYEIGPSIGINLALSSQGPAFSFNTDLSGSIPLSKAMDIGAGLSYSGNLSDDGKTSSGSNSFGVNGFSRYHFLETFANAPWVVPYVGAKLGLSSSDNFSYTSGSTTFNSSNSSTTTIALQLGSLFFIDQKTAMTLQLETGSNSSSSGGGATTSTSSLSLSLGLRKMF